MRKALPGLPDVPTGTAASKKSEPANSSRPVDSFAIQPSTMSFLACRKRLTDSIHDADRFIQKLFRIFLRHRHI